MSSMASLGGLGERRGGGYLPLPFPPFPRPGPRSVLVNIIIYIMHKLLGSGHSDGAGSIGIREIGPNLEFGNAGTGDRQNLGGWFHNYFGFDIYLGSGF